MLPDEISRIKALLLAFAAAVDEDDVVVPDAGVFQLAAEHSEADHRVLTRLIADALSDQR